MGSEISYCRNCGGIDTAVTSRTPDTLWHCARCCSTEIEEIDVEAVVQERDQLRAQVEDAERYKHADGDGTDRLVRAIHGRKAKGRDYIGGSQANMLHEGADLIEELRARVAELEGERAWRPIEEAPRDGTVIQAWIPANPTWGDLAKPVYAWFVGESDPYLEFVNEWVTADGRQRSRGTSRQAIHPTHWQPLPGGPEVERG